MKSPFDAHAGPKAAVTAILPGAGWQRCGVHFARNLTQKLGSARSKPVNAVITTIFAQTTQEAVVAQDRAVTDSLRGSLSEIMAMLEQAEPDMAAFVSMPREHWQKIWSNNPIERLNREITRRVDVVQIFGDGDCVTRLVGAVLQEQHEEWQYGECRYFSDVPMCTLIGTLHQTAGPACPELLTAWPSCIIEGQRNDNTPRDLTTHAKWPTPLVPNRSLQIAR